jgi:DNA helicase II / ATP-dependent DNA helicase PcrA
MLRLFDLNSEQAEAVRTITGPLLILAGAGTGKTRVITMRIVNLLEEGVPADKILAVTFTNKAAKEMRERVADMVDRKPARALTICTFHSLCVRILRADIAHLGYRTNFSIYDEGDQLGLIRKTIARLTAREEKVDATAIRNEISRAKNRGSGSAFGSPSSPTDLLPSVLGCYQEDLKTLNAVDFDDLLILAVRLLTDYPTVRQKWQGRFNYLLVDEFQDTNRLQLELVRSLGRSHRNVCVVGDDDQSIYGWRGAEVSNILEFERYFPNPKVVKLEQNYRSSNAILNTANSVIRHNPRRRPKTLWSALGPGEKVRLVAVPDGRKEAELVVGELQRRKLEHNSTWSDFAVLFRMNAQSRLLEEQLRRYQVPYRLIGGRSFFERREVKDILAYLQCLVNPQDDINLLRIINTPVRGIGASTIELATAESAGRSIYETLRAPAFLRLLSKRTQTAVQHFTELIDTFETKVHEPLADLPGLTESLVAEICYYSDLRRTCKNPEEALSREENVRELIRSLRDFQKRSSEGLAGFLGEAALDDQREEEPEPDRDSVHLITLHAAKGLEFNHVFLVGIEEGILPHDRSKAEGSLDEERRLLYVGITRARRSLMISHCAARSKYGSPAPCAPSSFLKDLDPDWFETVNYDAHVNQPASEGTARSHFARMKELLG